MSGASFTSRGIINATKKALEAAGGKAEDWNKHVSKSLVAAKDLVIAGGGLTGLASAA